MTVSVLESTDVKNKLEDLSGVVLKPGENPYNALIEACHNNPVCLYIYSFASSDQSPLKEYTVPSCDYK